MYRSVSSLTSEMETQNSAVIWVSAPCLVEGGKINSTHLSLTKDSVSECFQQLCLRVLLLWTGTTTKATLIRTTFNWGWLPGSEVQSIIIIAGSMAASRQIWCWRRSPEFCILTWRQSREDWHLRQLGGESQRPPPTVTYFLQQGFRYSTLETFTALWCTCYSDPYSVTTRGKRQGEPIVTLLWKWKNSFQSLCLCL